MTSAHLRWWGDAVSEPSVIRVAAYVVSRISLSLSYSVPQTLLSSWNSACISTDCVREPPNMLVTPLHVPELLSGRLALSSRGLEDY